MRDMKSEIIPTSFRDITWADIIKSNAFDLRAIQMILEQDWLFGVM